MKLFITNDCKTNYIYGHRGRSLRFLHTHLDYQSLFAILIKPILINISSIALPGESNRGGWPGRPHLICCYNIHRKIHIIFAIEQSTIRDNFDVRNSEFATFFRWGESNRVQSSWITKLNDKVAAAGQADQTPTFTAQQLPLITTRAPLTRVLIIKGCPTAAAVTFSPESDVVIK